MNVGKIGKSNFSGTAMAIIIAVVTLVSATAVRADFAKRLNYQGRLTDSNGVPLANGNYDMTFAIYDAQTGGTLIWSETHNGANQVAVVNGLFSTTLGDTATLNSVGFNGAEYWIQVAIGATTYTPRQRMTAAAFAMNVPDGIITSTKMADGAALNEILDDDGSGSGLDCDTLDGFDWGNLPNATDMWVNETGDTMTGQLTNTYNSGAPFVITSTTVNTNLNADMVDGAHAGNAANNVALNNGALNATLNADLLDGFNSPQLGNFGNWQVHGTYTDCNTDPSYWGWNYVQGNTNCPNTTSSQWYRGNFSLGSNYPMRGAGGYSMELAIPRDNVGAAGVWVRTVEGGTIGGWSRIDGSDPNAGAWTLSGNNLYPDSTAYNVAIGGTAPAVKLHVTGNAFIDTAASGAAGMHVTIKNNGQGQIYYSAYPGGWVPALQIQNTDNTHFMWIAASDSSNPAVIRTAASGLDIYTGGTVSNDNGVRAGSFDTSGNLTVAGDVTVSGSDVYLADTNTRLTEGGGNSIRLQTNSGYVDIGPQNGSFVHIYSPIHNYAIDGHFQPVPDNTYDLGSPTYRWRNIYMGGTLYRACPSGFVNRGNNLCVEDMDYAGYSMSSCAGLCASRGSNGAHMCTSIDVRQAMYLNTSIGNSWDNDFIGDQTADDQGLVVNAITNINIDGNDGNINDTDRWCRCCISLE
jgi:hypothetical protein